MANERRQKPLSMAKVARDVAKSLARPHDAVAHERETLERQMRIQPVDADLHGDSEQDPESER